MRYTLMLVLVWACKPAAIPSDTPDPPVPTSVPLGDTGLPPTVHMPEPFDVQISEPVVCSDSGRSESFYDRVFLGEDTATDAFRGWKGAGLAIDDFDGDGNLDIFAAGQERSVFWSRGINGWEELAAALFVPPIPTDAVGASTADYDGDGDPDLFVTFYEKPNRLYRNAGGVFTAVDAGLSEEEHRTTSSSWGDLDGDGWLDLVVGNYGPRPPDAWDPEMEPGDPSELYLNNGDGTFTDHSDMLPQSTHDAYTFMTSFLDVDGDGLPELFTISDFGWVRPSQLFWNRGGGVLELDDGTANFHPNFAGMGLAVGDLNGDRIPDFAQSSYEEMSLLQSGLSGLSTSGIGWAEFSDALGAIADPDENQYFGWGTAFGDLDNDADLDLVMGFGRWDEYTNPDSQSDGAWILENGSYVNRAFLPKWSIADAGSTRGVLLVDLDKDGHLDIVKRILQRPVVVQQSRCSPSTHWLSIAVRDDTTPNTRAIGARIEVLAGTTEQIAWQMAGGVSMFSGGPPESHFGMSKRLSADRIRVIYPDGERFDLWDVPTDRRVTITRTDP